MRNEDRTVTGSGTEAVRVAVVIPAYGQPSLLCEALQSALGQHTDFRYAIVVVNDGCPHPDTRRICLSTARANPGRIFYLEKRNGGLSAARNSGIDFALGAFPALEAVYFLDSDNRIGPHLLQRLLDGLRSGDARTGWAYTDIDKFGFAEFGDTSGPYSPLEHLFRNITEAGSMASRRMLDAGCRFDTNMRKGLEDWEFWMQGLEKGFHGVHVPDAGFRYRRRGESMLAAAERDLAPILSYLHARHPALFTPAAVLQTEIATSARYAVYHPDTDRVSLMVTAGSREIVDREAYLERLLHAMERPGYGQCPGHLAVMDEALFGALAGLRMLTGTLWMLECALRRAALVTVTFREPAPDQRLGWSSTRIPVGADQASPITPTGDVHIVAADAGALLASVTSDHALQGLAAQSHKLLHGLFLEAAMAGLETAPLTDCDAAGALADLQHALLDTAARQHRNLWRQAPHDRYRARPASPGDVYPHLFGLPSLLPCTAQDNGRRAALVVETGGKRTLAAASSLCRNLKHEGWTVDLVVLGREIAGPAGVLEGFAEIVTLPLDCLQPTLAPMERRRYFATSAPRPGGYEADDALATLANHQLVISVDGDLAHTVMGRLRTFKVKTWAYLGHGDDRRTPSDMVHGCTAFEAAYDGVIVTEERMWHLCRALGIPHGKLRLLPASDRPAPPETTNATDEPALM